jgi:hypothetical protein
MGGVRGAGWCFLWGGGKWLSEIVRYVVLFVRINMYRGARPRRQSGPYPSRGVLSDVTSDIFSCFLVMFPDIVKTRAI